MSTTFSLASALGWHDLNGLPIQLNPIIAMTESAGITSDLLHTMIVAHLLQIGHTVCVIGVRNSSTHFASLCKKVGPINVEQYMKSGHLLYIDCLNPFHVQFATLKNTEKKNENDQQIENKNENQTLLSQPQLPTDYSTLYTKLSGAYTFHQQQQQKRKQQASPQQSQSTLSSPFSVCIDDLSLLNSLNCTDSSNSTDMIDFLTNILRFTHQTLFESITPSSQQQQQQQSSPSSIGTLSFALLSHLTQCGPTPRQPSTLFKQSTPTSLIFPTNNITQTETDPRFHTVFDIPITNGGYTSHIIHWVSNLNYFLYKLEMSLISSLSPSPSSSSSSSQLSPQQQSSIQNNNSTLLIELSPLLSGYSKDIYCQLTILTPPNSPLVGNINNNQTNTQLTLKSTTNILFLVVGTSGTLICHSRA